MQLLWLTLVCIAGNILDIYTVRIHKRGRKTKSSVLKAIVLAIMAQVSMITYLLQIITVFIVDR
jgi:hypothetical protein